MSYRIARRWLSLVSFLWLVACGGQVIDDSQLNSNTQGGLGGSAANTHKSTSTSGQGGLNGGNTAIGSEGFVGIQPIDFPEVCGDNILVYLEECDDGNTIDDDGCSATCKVEPAWCHPYCSTIPSGCGNGQLTLSESCDDGNYTSGDGCSSACAIEEGWLCPYEGKRCTAVCGDSLVVGTETCDRGAYNGKYEGNVENGCSSLCRIAPSCTLEGAPSPCTETCTLTTESAFPEYCPGFCGNSIVDWNEQCDNGDGNNDDTYGGCTTQCQYGPFCGDGVLNGEEECDLGPSNNATYGIRNGCTRTCHFSHYCGDGILDSSFDEQCDAGLESSHSHWCTSDCWIIL